MYNFTLPFSLKSLMLSDTFKYLLQKAFFFLFLRTEIGLKAEKYRQVILYQRKLQQTFYNGDRKLEPHNYILNKL